MKVSKLILTGVILLGSLTAASAFNPFDNSTKTGDTNADMGLPEYTGIKHPIGVINFSNDAGWASQWDLGSNLGIMLESALYDSGRFIVLERGDLGAVLAEQDLQSSGRAASASKVAQTGQVRSARYLASGSITSVEYNQAGTGGGLSFKGISLGANSKKAQIDAIIKIIDSTTGQIVAKQSVRGEAGRSGLTVGVYRGGFGGQLGGFDETPLGEAAMDVVNQAVKFIAREMEDYEIDGTVVMVRGDQVVINRGSEYGVSPGHVVIAQESGEALIDPDTGELLDYFEGDVIATMKVTKVSEKVAYCEVSTGQLPSKGDTVKFAF